MAPLTANLIRATESRELIEFRGSAWIQMRAEEIKAILTEGCSMFDLLDLDSEVSPMELAHQQASQQATQEAAEFNATLGKYYAVVRTDESRALRTWVIAAFRCYQDACIFGASRACQHEPIAIIDQNGIGVQIYTRDADHAIHAAA